MKPKARHAVFMPPRTGDQPREPRPGPLLAGIFGCQAAAALSIGLGARPGLGLLFAAAAVWLGVVGARRFRRASRVAGARQLADAWRGAARAAADGAPAVAIAILEQARSRAGLDGPTARLLVELHASTDQVGHAVEVAVENLDLLEPGDVRNMIASLESWGERRHAAALTAALGLQRTATRNRRGNGNSRWPSVRTG